ncbi:hypothetical protein DM02DRAFT_536311 [Periconia macrospinosa]|uniref:Uncharacterized protein n=1 Tax=Periconia macrospinosa TaxID=97972 RepID=A0A2V1DD31_9PLEO|nr:hypothetical protein DM02DRAFT_536311 [Periconia macrospinosa]
MTSTADYVIVDPRNIGLDRTIIHNQGRIEIPDEPPKWTRRHRGDEEEEKRRHSTFYRVRESLSEKKHDTAVKIKKTLDMNKHVNTSIDEELERNGCVLVDSVPQDSGSRLKEKPPLPKKPSVKEFLQDPIENTKKKISDHSNSQAAASIAKKEIPHGQDVDLIRVHETLEKSNTVEEQEKALEIFEEMMKERQHIYVRWTLDRHVVKVRVSPKMTFVKKSKRDFLRKDPAGNYAVDWRAYGKHVNISFRGY